MNSERPGGAQARPADDFAKQTLDFWGALLGLLLVLPVMLFCALFVVLDSPGPALFRQVRVGRGGKLFTLLKFRTMHLGTPNVSTAELAQKAKSPVTRAGAFLRRWSLDELPQLLNVLRGEMSLVGPRPALPSQTRLNALREKWGVHALLPGLTGWAQINGRDEMDDDTKAAFDREYLQNRSFLWDVEILLGTLRPVATGKGNR